MILGLVIGGTVGYLIGSGTKVKVERKRNPQRLTKAQKQATLKGHDWARFASTK